MWSAGEWRHIILSKCRFSFAGQSNRTNLTILFSNRGFIIPLHSNFGVNNMKVVFLL